MTSAAVGVLLLADGVRLVLVLDCDRRNPSTKDRPGRKLLAELLVPATTVTAVAAVADVVVAVVAMEVKDPRPRTSGSSHSISSSELVSALATIAGVGLAVFFWHSRFQSIVFSRALASVLR